jgi:hypothetical protein
MNKTYKSKIGMGLLIPIVIVLGTVLLVMVYNDLNWFELLILLPVIGFVVHMFMTTYYVIIGNRLKIKCGFLYSLDIDISTIKKITPTKNPLSSPALSLDRLEITYGKFDSVLISPKDKKDFIAQLKIVNPKIECNLFP